HGPIYKIEWFDKDTNKKNIVYSMKSTTDVANLYIKSNYQFENKKTALSGPLIFGLHLKILESERIRHQRSKILQPINKLSNSTQCIRAKELAKPILTTFNNKSQNLYHPDDSPELNQIIYELSNTVWNIQFKQKNNEKEQILPYVKAIDKGKVTQKGYQALVAISHDIPREYLVSQTQSNINSTMNQQICISLIDINQYLNSEINIDNIENENVVYGITESVGKAGY
ncbi:8775_t:CDS:2, partial [Gigaspora rosea]